MLFCLYGECGRGFDKRKREDKKKKIEKIPPRDPNNQCALLFWLFWCVMLLTWWMPASCANALAPTIALLGCTMMPVNELTMRDARGGSRGGDQGGGRGQK